MHTLANKRTKNTINNNSMASIMGILDFMRPVLLTSMVSALLRQLSPLIATVSALIGTPLCVYCKLGRILSMNNNKYQVSYSFGCGDVMTT